MDFGHWDRLTGYYGNSLALSGTMAGGQTQWTGGLVEAVGAVQAFSGGFDWTSLVTPAPHSDNHYDPNGNHIVYEGTSNSFVLDLGLANDPSNGALAGQSVQYSAFIGSGTFGLDTTSSAGNPTVTTVGIDWSGNGYVQSEFAAADGTTTSLIVPIEGFNYQNPIVSSTPYSPSYQDPYSGSAPYQDPYTGSTPYSASYQDAYATAAYGQDPLASSGLSSAHYQDSYAISMAYSDFSTGSLWS